MAIKKTAGAPVEIKSLDIRTVDVPIVGVSELIVHNWSEKAKRQMLDKQMKNVKTKKEAKDPQADYESSIYKFTDGRHGFPAGGFKAAIVGACRLFDGLPMTQAKIAIMVNGTDGSELVEIKGNPYMREDMVRLESGVADIRYRAAYPEWKATLNITFNAGMLSIEQLINLVNGAGFGGIGEWRPSAPKTASGSFGRFKVAVSVEDIENA